ncbi:hypothetical protein [Nocardia jiangxiensis]|uniref:hypothetical protein n=1 Tax=Nocardia jiangxiensis TaxID=282685 RepID=UPI00146BF4B0|nr:hypothetical protein [Nocardia jiangxiensis]
MTTDMRYAVQQIHSCDLCGYDDELLGIFDTADEARAAAQAEESKPIEWDLGDKDPTPGDEDFGYPDRDSLYTYYIYARED